MKADLNKPLQVDTVYIKGRPDPIRNCIVFMLNNFVIIAKDPGDTRPTWYNVNLIEKLEGVQAETIKTRIG